MGQKRSKVCNLEVAIPSGQSWNCEFGMSMVYLMNYLITPCPGYDQNRVRVINHKGSILPVLREVSVDSGMERGAEWFFFVDSDMVFPKEAIHMMIEHKAPVVAANCATKTMPSNPTARAFDGTEGGRHIYTRPGSPRVEECWRVGTGVMLVHRSVFEEIPAPRFEILWKAERAVPGYEGEDWRFAALLEEKGIPILIDHQVSVQVGHIGTYRYGHDLIEMQLQEKGL